VNQLQLPAALTDPLCYFFVLCIVTGGGNENISPVGQLPPVERQSKGGERERERRRRFSVLVGGYFRTTCDRGVATTATAAMR